MNQELKIFMIFTSMVPFPSRSTSIIRLLSSSSVGFWPMALMTPSSSLEEMAPLPSCCIPPVKCNMQNWVHLVKLIKCFFEFSSLYFLWAKSSKYAKLTRRKSYFDSWILCVSWHFEENHLSPYWKNYFLCDFMKLNYKFRWEYLDVR